MEPRWSWYSTQCSIGKLQHFGQIPLRGEEHVQHPSVLLNVQRSMELPGLGPVRALWQPASQALVGQSRPAARHAEGTGTRQLLRKASCEAAACPSSAGCPPQQDGPVALMPRASLLLRLSLSTGGGLSRE